MTTPAHWDRLLHLTRQGDLAAAASLKTEATRRGDLPSQALACATLKDVDGLVSLALSAKAKGGLDATLAWARALGVLLSAEHVQHINDLIEASNWGRAVRLIGWVQVFKAIASALLAAPEGGVSCVLEHAGCFTGAMRAGRTSACLAVYVGASQTLTLGIQQGASGSPSPPVFWPSLRPWRRVMLRNAQTLTRWATEPPQEILPEPFWKPVLDRLSIPCKPPSAPSPPSQAAASHPALDRFKSFLKMACAPNSHEPLNAVIAQLRAWPTKAQPFLGAATQEALAAITSWPQERRRLHTGDPIPTPAQPWDLWYRSLRLSSQPGWEAIWDHPSLSQGLIQHVWADLAWRDSLESLTALLTRCPNPLESLTLRGSLHEIRRAFDLPVRPAQPIASLRVDVSAGVLRDFSASPLLSKVEALSLPDTLLDALSALLSGASASALRALTVRCIPRVKDASVSSAFRGAPLALTSLHATLSFPHQEWSLGSQSDPRTDPKREIILAHFDAFARLIAAGHNPQTLRDLTLVLSADFGNGYRLTPAMCDKLLGCAQQAPSLTRLQVISQAPARALHLPGTSLLTESNDARGGGGGHEGLISLLSGPPKPLQSLTLRRIGLGDMAAAYIAKAPSLAALEDLDLSENNLSPDGFATLYQAEALSGLRSLCLGRNPVRFPKRGKQKPHGWRLRALTHLDLGGSAVTASDLTVLASLLADGSLPSLQTLSLVGCQLGASGARALAAAPVFSVLQRLDLTQCSLGHASIQLIQSLPWTYGRVVGLSVHADAST